MRKLILLRGAPGIGKSTFIRNQGLEGYTLSPDTLRLIKGGVVMTPEGRIGINPTNDHRVWDDLERILDDKMGRGEFIIFDATFQHTRDFKMHTQLAYKHRYDIYCIDFSGQSADLALARNTGREIHKRVPDDVITRAYQRFSDSSIPPHITVFAASEFEQSSVLDKFDVQSVDLNAYKKIHHIGDLQGCYSPVAEYFKEGFKDDEFYIFVGDFLDRGIENGEVIRWIVDHVMDRPNVVFLWGNHETHIHRYATKQQAVSKEFQNETFPQLKEANFTQQEADRLCAKLQDCFIYHYGQTKCLVTHAGLATVPVHPILISSLQYWKGTGTYEHPVDQVFSDNMKGTDWIQVHGHRNSKSLPIQAAPKSYNLEAEVEFGGYLRVMTLTQDGLIEEIQIQNNIYRKAVKAVTEESITESEEGKISQEILQRLTAHDFVRRKKFVSHPHISSYNFTRRAFSKGVWDKVSLSARGLFVDDDRRIVARSYNKFFNLEERPETQWRNLQRTLSFPVNMFVKENGFLGILGYDAAQDELFFASKSTPESEFAGWFQAILTETVGTERIDYLRRALKDQNLSLVFEVNDPVNDPHMIEYDQPHVILLDAIYRSESFKRLDYADLQKFAANYSIPFKEKAIVFHDWESFKSWHDNMATQGQNYTFKGKHIEGFVIEDSKDFMFKIKLPYYSFWKYMRGLKEKIVKSRTQGDIFNHNPSSAEEASFYTWAVKQHDQILEKDIITLRKLYLESLS